MAHLARHDALLLQQVGGQTVVYDQRNRRLHVLSRTAALVWQHCDGQRDVAQLVEVVGQVLDAPISEEVILLALGQLEEAVLLAAPQRPTRPADAVSRRDMVNRVLGGLAAGVLLPVVTSCGSIVEPVIGAVSRNDVPVTTTTSTTGTTPLVTTTSTTGTTPLNTTTTSTTGTTPLNTTTTSTTATTPLVTTTTSTTGTTTTSTTSTTTTRPPKKVVMCHNGQTIKVDARAVAVHLAHGDTLGPCQD